MDLLSLPAEIRRGPLFERQHALGATFYDDYGRLWTASFGDVDREYEAIRGTAMVWDISPLSKFHLKGPQVWPALERLTTRPVAGDEPGQVRYTAILDADGCIVDEGTRYLLSHDEAWFIGNEDRPALVEHIASVVSGFDVTMENRTDEVAALAVQGPRSFEVLAPIVDGDLASLEYFRCTENLRVADMPALVSRTGFSGELGYELFVPAGIEQVWDALVGAGATPVGLDAVEMARVEVGFLVADEDYVSFETDPYEVGLGSFIDLEGHAFEGREAAIEASHAEHREFMTLVFDDGRRPEAHVPVTVDGRIVGEVRSVERSPRFGMLGLAAMDADVAVVGAFVDVNGIGAAVRARPLDDEDRARRTRPGRYGPKL
jgi:aminomethyltransferase